MGFESAPFKLTQEYVDIMGGIDSDMYCLFKNLLMRGLTIVRKHIDELINLIKIMAAGQEGLDFSVSGRTSTMPCIKNMVTLEIEIRERISTRFNKGSHKN